MKKLLTVLLLSLLLITCAVAEEEAAPLSFRYGLTFESTLDDVIAAEGSRPAAILDNTAFYPNSEVANRKADVVYMFDDDKIITECTIIFRDTHYDMQEYVRCFDKLDGQLSEKYGEPYVDRFVYWSDSTFKDSSSLLGYAICLNQAKMMSSWRISNLEIAHLLTGSDYEITEAVMYTPSTPRVTADPTPSKDLGI